MPIRHKRDFKVAEKFALRLKQVFHDVNLILYGSRARGNGSADSDMDICVTVAKLNRKTRDTIFDIAWEVGFAEGVVIVPMIFEKKEWLDSPINQSTIYKTIIKEGIRL